MTAAQEQRLAAFLISLAAVPWFANAGVPSDKYHVVADAVIGWDDWTHQMVAVWVARIERLEAQARDAIGNPAIDEVFTRVHDAIEVDVRTALKAYFARRPNRTENTDCGADAALWREILDFVLRDMSWAAVETVLDRPDFFVSLLAVHNDGRWPCAWEGSYPHGRFVVL